MQTHSKKPRIAIQGYEGCFHQEAANHYFDTAVSPYFCPSFREVITAAKDRTRTDGCLMAIENSIAGSILPNYSLLQKSGLLLVGEIYMQIHQNLLVNKGIQLKDISEVHSHTMALQQCYEFLDEHDYELVETEDTALSARYIAQHNLKTVGAVASSLAADLYGLEIIAPKIQTLKNNYTRFLVLKRPEDVEIPQRGNKASVRFETTHAHGSLVQVLDVIARAGINLCKIQSFPLPGTDFNYQFHADMEFNCQETFQSVIMQLEEVTNDLQVYGIYKKGIWK